MAAALIAEMKNCFLIADPLTGTTPAYDPSVSNLRRISSRRPSKRIALVFQQLKILLLVTIQEHAHLPRPREHLLVLDQRLVSQVVRSSWRVAFNHVQGVAVEISGPGEPGLVV